MQHIHGITNSYQRVYDTILFMETFTEFSVLNDYKKKTHFTIFWGVHVLFNLSTVMYDVTITYIVPVPKLSSLFETSSIVYIATVHVQPPVLEVGDRGLKEH